MLLAFLSSDIISVSVIVSEDMYPSKVGGPASAPPVTGVPVAPNAFGGVENQPLWSTGLCDCMDDFGNLDILVALQDEDEGSVQLARVPLLRLLHPLLLRALRSVSGV
ncbi:hypothetical protein BHE74_00040063 [Ensete ventricosum]|nr:hypothetical protein BHE74_00040063 [Ensete ventricosum]